MRALTYLIFPLITLSSTLSGAAGWPGFVTPYTYSYVMPEEQARWAATGDLNGDGFPEVVISQASYLQVMINHAGVLTAGAKYTVGSIKRVLMADVNRDGRLDVVAVGNLTAVLLGKGDGTLQTPTLLSGIGDDAALGDVNRDGYPDLVVANSAGVQVRLNTQHGSFGAAALVTSIAISRVAVSDLNGDGNGDIVATNGDILVMLGGGDGTFATPLMSPASATAFAVGDVNRDGVPDILEAGTGSARVLVGNGDGSFRAGASIAVACAQAVSLGDFNGDGWVDMAVSGFTTNVYGIGTPTGLTVLLGNGDGSFHAGKSYAFGGAQNPVVDMNGDGRLDLVIGGVAIAFGNGDGSFRAAEQVSTGTSGARQMIAADFRRDGQLEFVIVGQNEHVRVLHESGNRWANSEVAGLIGTAVAAADYDGDGKLDLAAITEGGLVVVATGNADLSFGEAKESASGTLTATLLSAGRLNRDRLADVVVGSGGTLQVLMAAGSGYFAAPVSLTLENGDAAGAAIADLNLDSVGDIVVRHDSGFTVLLGDASGKYFDQRYIDAAGKIGGFLVQDLNGDAKPDLVYTASMLGKVYVLWGDGAGNFTAGGTYSVVSPGEITAGNVNGDAIPDLIVCSDNGGLATLLGTAQHTFSPPSYWYANVGQSSPVVANANQDSVPDVVTLDPFGALTIFENGGFTQPVSPSLTISANLFDFGSQTIRQESAPQTVVLANNGNINLSLRLSAVGEFTESDSCGPELRVGAACMATFTFKPAHIGAQSATAQIANGLDFAVTLQGLGLDISASGTRPSRNTRALPPVVTAANPSVAAATSSPAARIAPTILQKRKVVVPRGKLLPRKLVRSHTTW